MSIHLKISDRNWILETMAQHLASRLDYVTYDTAADPAAEIQYYLTYSTYRGRVSPIELAYFTHLEEDPGVRERFFSTAKAVDGCVCMSEIYASMLREHGTASVEVIPPGVDLKTFDVKLRIGVVGRTYSTGRKGEALVAAVMDTPGVEFLFTGEGWPGPALKLADEAMPAFYRSLDYVLVPARYEGGPMSAIEALACGVEVIAPPVGWVPELPHIEYKLNDAADLRRVLTGLVKDKQARREAVLGRSWDVYAERHDALFRRLLGKPPSPRAASVAASRLSGPSVRLVTHGVETNARGGPSTRIPQLAQGLQSKGYRVEFGNYGNAPLSGADLYHLFNVATPTTAEQAMEGLASFGRPVVFSPIYLDNRCRQLWRERVPRLFASPQQIGQMGPALEQLKAEARILRSRPIQRSDALPRRYHQGIARILARADHVIYLSELEREMLAEATGQHPPGTVIHNPVEVEAFRSADPASFESAFGVKDFALCVGRIEPRKNQLMLAMALSGTGMPLVLVGESIDSGYQAQIEAVPDLELVLTGRIDAGSPMLASALAASRVFALPSWSEGAPIAALEAAAAGCNMVLSSYSSEAEYFGDHARYADPADLSGLRAQLLAARDSRWSNANRAALSDFTAENFSVKRHAERTAAVYETLLSHPLPAPVVPAQPPAEAVRNLPAPPRRTVYFDVTTLLNHPGRITGITRVELALTRMVRPEDDVRFVAWHLERGFYFEVEPRFLEFDNAPGYRSARDIRPLPDLPRDSILLVQGNAWLRNTGYVRALERLVRINALRLVLLIHDILPLSHPQYFEEDQISHLDTHLGRLSQFVSAFGADSVATKRDLETYLLSRQAMATPIEVIRLGDGLDDGIIGVGPAGTEATPRRDAVVEELVAHGNFVLSVGSQVPHKNRNLLFRIWNRLVAEMGPAAPRLVIVGKHGAEDTNRILDRAATGHVLQLQSVSDVQLSALYQRCLFTLFPSLCEGWGLPVAESLGYGKICIASNVSSMPEIAPDVTDLIDPFDAMSWYTRVRHYVGSAEARQRREAEIAARFAPSTWRNTLDQLLALARKAQSRSFTEAAWDFAVPFDFANADHMARAAVDRQEGAEGVVTTMTFRLTTLSNEPTRLSLLCGSTGQGLVELRLDGALVETLVMGREAERLHSILLPAQSPGTQVRTLAFHEIGNVGFRPRRFVLLPVSSAGEEHLPHMELAPAVPIEGEITVRKARDEFRKLLSESWYPLDPDQVWSKPRARLALPLSTETFGAVELALTFKVMRDGPVLLRIGKDFCTALHGVAGIMAPSTVEIPFWVIASCGSHLEIEFEVLNAASPVDVNPGSTDRRLLGLCLERLEYKTLDCPASLPPPRAGHPPFDTLLGHGWHAGERDHVWSRGTGQLRLPGQNYGGRTLAFFIATAAKQALHVLVDGRLVETIMLASGEERRILLTLPAAQSTDAMVDILLVSSQTASPSELGLSADPRQLGICLRGISETDPHNAPAVPGAGANGRRQRLRRLIKRHFA